MEKAGKAKEDQETALETEQLQDYILGKMDNNLKIPANLETIKIGDTTYNVTAEEGVGGAIAIKLTKPGEQTPIKTYDLESDIKIKRVTIRQTPARYIFKLNDFTWQTSGDSSFRIDGTTFWSGIGANIFENTNLCRQIGETKIFLKDTKEVIFLKMV